MLGRIGDIASEFIACPRLFANGKNGGSLFEQITPNNRFLARGTSHNYEFLLNSCHGNTAVCYVCGSRSNLDTDTERKKNRVDRILQRDRKKIRFVRKSPRYNGREKMKIKSRKSFLPFDYKEFMHTFFINLRPSGLYVIAIRSRQITLVTLRDNDAYCLISDAVTKMESYRSYRRFIFLPIYKFLPSSSSHSLVLQSLKFS